MALNRTKERRATVVDLGPTGWDRDLPRLSVVIAIVGVLWVVLWQLHPNLLLSSSTTTGGDTGAHYILPAFLKGSLLTHGHLTGWFPGWYDGFPLYTYYFVFPDLLAALGSYLIPYGVAFKLATIAGSVLMPIAAYWCGRLFRLTAPIPAVLAVAILPFLFDSTFTIDGGNLFSTLAGEYAFSLSLALSLVVIGLFARGARTGAGSIVTPIVMAVCLASHLVPYLFAVLGAAVVSMLALLPARWLPGDEAQGGTLGLRPPPQPPVTARLWWALRTAALGLALSAWWVVPFATTQNLTNAMGYVNDTQYVAKLFPTADLWLSGLAFIALVVGLIRRSRFAITFSILAIVMALAFVLDPQGALWNERLLPLWTFSCTLLAGWIVGVTLAAIARGWRRRRLERFASGRTSSPPTSRIWLPGAVAGPLVALVLAVVVVVTPMVPQVVPVSWLNAIGITPGANQVSSWAAWNYSGMESKPAYPEYRSLISTMESLTKTYGCGRAMWEYNSDLDRFGTPMALMLLPYWTNGCVGSQEGLFFESSATTPYHFLIQAEVSSGPSDPEVGLPYGTTNVALGVKHLQLLGVKYLMLSSPATQAQAHLDPDLQLLTTSGPWAGSTGTPSTTTWKIYLIKNSPTVVGLTHLPVVVPGIAASQDSWRSANVTWFLDPARWKVPLAASGPASWPRGTASATTSPTVVPPRVTNVSTGTSSVSFDVSHVGTPVVVKVSYFPQWQVTGATGPYRVSPNLMVVVPTSTHVTLHYGEAPSNVLGALVSALALALLVVLAVLQRRRSS